MHATIDVRFTISLDNDKTLPLAMLAEFLTDQNIESVILESVVESLDASHVEAYCGQKHAHGNGNHHFQRAGTDTRTAVTTAGDHESTLHYVEDTAADHDQSSYFRPVEDVLDFDGQNRYQQDIAAKSVDLATSLSYRDAADHGDGFVSMPSPTTTNRRAREYGSKLKQFLSDCVTGTEVDAIVADGTKCHSQDEDRSYHSVQATLGENTADNSRSLLDLSVNTDWNETASDLDTIDAVTDDATDVSDADEGIVTAFTDDTRTHQLDLVHVGQTSVEELRPRFGGGRPPKLTPEQWDKLCDLLEEGQPWTPREIHALIEDRYGVTYHPAHLSRKLRQAGMNYAKPRPMDPRRPDDAEGILAERLDEALDEDDHTSEEDDPVILGFFR